MTSDCTTSNSFCIGPNTLPGHRGASMGQVSFSDDGNVILSSNINRKSIVWQIVK